MGQKYCVKNNSQTSEPNEFVLFDNMLLFSLKNTLHRYDPNNH
jgi:hypothetical protein